MTAAVGRGTITLSADGAKVAGGRIEQTIPTKISINEGLDVGMDIGSPVDYTYDPPFAFTGSIEAVHIDLSPGTIACHPRPSQVET
ncbi:MAG: hypothetical protein R2845_00780 [Thermomicrobiales bacterium]